MEYSKDGDGFTTVAEVAENAPTPANMAALSASAPLVEKDASAQVVPADSAPQLPTNLCNQSGYIRNCSCPLCASHTTERQALDTKQLRERRNFPTLAITRCNTKSGEDMSDKGEISRPNVLPRLSTNGAGFLRKSLEARQVKVQVPSERMALSRVDHNNTNINVPLDLPPHPTHNISLGSTTAGLCVDPPRMSRGFWKSIKLTPGEINLKLRAPSAICRRSSLSAKRSYTSTSQYSALDIPTQTSSTSRYNAKNNTQVPDPAPRSKSSSARDKTLNPSSPTTPHLHRCRRRIMSSDQRTSPSRLNPALDQRELDDPDKINEDQVERILQRQLIEFQPPDDPIGEGQRSRCSSQRKACVKSSHGTNAIHIALKAAHRNTKPLTCSSRNSASSASTTLNIHRTPLPRPMTSSRVRIGLLPGGNEMERQTTDGIVSNGIPNQGLTNDMLLRTKTLDVSGKIAISKEPGESRGRKVRPVTSRSLTLFNESLPDDATHSYFISGPGQQGKTVVKPILYQVLDNHTVDWRHQISPKQWLQLLRANGSDEAEYNSLGVDSLPTETVSPTPQRVNSPIRLPNIDLCGGSASQGSSLSTTASIDCAKDNLTPIQGVDDNNDADDDVMIARIENDVIVSEANPPKVENRAVNWHDTDVQLTNDPKPNFVTKLESKQAGKNMSRDKETILLPVVQNGGNHHSRQLQIVFPDTGGSGSECLIE